MEYSIEVHKVSKDYILGKQSLNSYATLRETLTDKARALFGVKSDQSSASENKVILQALKEVSFSARPGEVIGIVGRNGAGKSTLLKILSRITDPSRGQIAVRGRLASLLEVGTGFHPELTGRENVFLNGALLGMKKHEIKRKFDQIVAFAEVEKFIDTPVKRYSSGMYIRLAFSVAAHLEPDILVLDEVLAVGDVAFQKKCTGVVKDVASQQRTVLFVSHNLHLIRSLCSRVIFLHQGQLIQDGKVEEVLPNFIRTLQQDGQVGNSNLQNRTTWGTGSARIEQVEFVDAHGKSKWSYRSEEPLSLKVKCDVLKDLDGLSVMLSLKNPLSGDVITTVKEQVCSQVVSAGQKKEICLEFPKTALRPGEFLVEVSVFDCSGERLYDFVGSANELPFLTVTSEERDPQKRQGYFSMSGFVKELA